VIDWALACDVCRINCHSSARQIHFRAEFSIAKNSPHAIRCEIVRDTHGAVIGSFQVMADAPTLTSEDIREIGEALYGAAWRSDMARDLGVPRQSIAYYLRAGGVNRTQAAAIIGLVARTAAREQVSELVRQTDTAMRQSSLSALLVRFDR
jgi:hypothetical protein